MAMFKEVLSSILNLDKSEFFLFLYIFQFAASQLNFQTSNKTNPNDTFFLIFIIIFIDDYIYTPLRLTPAATCSHGLPTFFLQYSIRLKANGSILVVEIVSVFIRKIRAVLSGAVLQDERFGIPGTAALRFRTTGEIFAAGIWRRCEDDVRIVPKVWKVSNSCCTLSLGKGITKIFSHTS